MAASDFEALEQRVLRTVEMLKQERELRIAAEERTHAAESRLKEFTARVAPMEAELTGLKTEREGVRSRVEILLKQLDDLAI